MNARALAAVAAVVLVLVLGVALLYAYRGQTPPVTASAAPTPTASATPSSTATPAPTAAPVGAITGLFRYPTGGFLPALTTYAVSVADSRVFFSVATPRFFRDVTPAPTPSGPFGSYTITGLAPGTYYVFAYRDSDLGGPPDLPGLYSQYLFKCVPPPTTADCTDHSLIPVTVRAGETVSGIDIADWLGYPTTATYPPRPTR